MQIESPPCPGEAGNATVTGFTPDPPFSYLWSDGQTTATATGLLSGQYFVTVTDSELCSFVEEALIFEPFPMVLSTSVTQPTCDGFDGSIAVTPSGGNPPYLYEFPWGPFFGTLTGLAAGQYPIIVTDANGCIQTTSVQLPASNSTLTTITQNEQAVSCFGESDGESTAFTFGGIPPYTYEWDSGETGINAITLDAGWHGLTTTDNEGCSYINFTFIGSPEELQVIPEILEPISCDGEEDATATLNVTGGTPPYLFSWDFGGSAQTETNLSEGTYSTTVTDNNGCQVITPVEILPPSDLQLNLTVDTDQTCVGGFPVFGTASTNVTGGFPPYTYNWSTGETTANASLLTPYVNGLTVTDANGCSESSLMFIHADNPFTVSSTITSPTCFGDANGSIEVMVSGGIAPYALDWSTGDTGEMINGLPSGDFYLYITDANGCLDIDTFSLEAPPQLDLSNTTATAATCDSAFDGGAVCVATGGTPPYDFVWSNGANSPSINGLTPGIYDLTVVDANECSAVTSLLVGFC